ncbi:cytochrome C oxidase [Frateuria sp. Soil773]|uniref:cbb3-type cytochrome oxidase subunit 3 n=1 Tax=Frateuria sp. Soil773 TaxID=1736407 RepID=UPI0006FD7A73|nr:cbb3-type cytochrome c oxidase subunit 3 [Frateuria sp. Soil773]KRF01800.1 cytochrome C oxidase [Frateuria sp. Soil773]
MSPVWGHVAGVITTLLMLVFVGIWIWAWRARHKRVFARMAQLPMEDEIDANATDTQEDRP